MVPYSLLLSHYLSIAGTPSSDSLGTPLERTARAYEELRKPRVHQIIDVAKRLRNAKRELGWFAQMVQDMSMWMFCKFLLLPRNPCLSQYVQVNFPSRCMTTFLVTMQRKPLRNILLNPSSYAFWFSCVIQFPSISPLEKCSMFYYILEGVFRITYVLHIEIVFCCFIYTLRLIWIGLSTKEFFR